MELNSDWKKADARYEIYIYDSTDNTSNWYTMEKVDDTTYKYSVPNEVINKVSGNEKNIIFVRCNPTLPEHEWASKYNQTVNLKIPTNGDTKFTIKSGSGDNYNGEWSAAPDDNSVTVTAPTVANGTVYIGTDDTTQTSTTLTFTKGTAASFYVKAEPNTGYAFKNWTVNGTTISDNPVMVSVSDTGALSVNGTPISSLSDLVPTFEGGTTGEKTTLYLVPNTWNKDGAKFAVHLINPKTYPQPEMWLPMEKVDGNDNLYKVDVPSQYDYQKVIFCRMNSNPTEYNEDNVWNKSDELNFPTDNQTKFTVTKDKWNGNIGTWSTP